MIPFKDQGDLLKHREESNFLSACSPSHQESNGKVRNAKNAKLSKFSGGVLMNRHRCVKLSPKTAKGEEKDEEEDKDLEGDDDDDEGNASKDKAAARLVKSTSRAILWRYF